MKHLAHVALALTIPAFVVALGVAFGACSKPNDLPALQTEAEALSKYYAKHVTELQHRMEHLNQRSKQLANPTDRDAAAAAFADASTALRELNGTVTMIKQQADELAKQGKRAELERLVATAEDKMADAQSRIAEDLGTDDAWLADQEHAPASAPPPVHNEDGSAPPP